MDSNKLQNLAEKQPLLPKVAVQPAQHSENLSSLHGYFLICLSTIGFSLMSLFIHIAETAYSFPSTSSAFIRGVIHTTFATVYLFFLSSTTSIFSHLTNRQRFLLLFRGLVGSLDLVFLYISLRLLPVGDAVTLFFCGPIFTILLSSLILKEPIKRLELLAAFISFIGVIVVARPGISPGVNPTDRIYGSIAALLAAFLSAVTYVAVSSLGTAIHFMTSVFSFSAATIFTAAAIGGAISPAELFTNKQGAALTVLAALFAFGGQCCLNKGLQLCRAGPGILIRNLDVPMAYTLGLIFLGERPSWLGLLGSSLVILGTVMVGIIQVMRL